MKKIVTFALCLGFGLAFSQTNQPETTYNPDNNTEKTVTTPVEYPGGMTALMQDISQVFDLSCLEKASGTSKSLTTFDVNPDGSISSISTTGNNRAMNKEMDRVMNALKKRWKPATKNGQAIKSTYNVPMTFKNY